MSSRLVHFSDLHLGFRAFPGTDRGWNLRERDLATAFQRGIQEAARLSPRIVLLTGDLFHRPDPPSTAFLSLTRGIRTLQSMVPGVTVLAIAGERDTPLSPADPGPVAVLDALPGVEAAAGAPRAVRFQEDGIHVLLAPYRAVQGPAHPELRPDPDARFNILLLRTRPGSDPLRVEVDPSQWDYVALGGSHVPGALAANVRCPGSLERVGWDPWAEATEEKGFVSFDLETAHGEFHPVQTRPVVDLAPIRVDAQTPEDGTRRLRDLVDGVPGGVVGKLLRVRLQGAGSFPEEGVDPGFLEGLRRKTGYLEVLRVEMSETPQGGGRELQEPDPFASGSASHSFTLDPGIHLVLPTAEGGGGTLRNRLLELLGLMQDTRGAADSLDPGLALKVGGSPEHLLRVMARLLRQGMEGDSAMGEGASPASRSQVRSEREEAHAPSEETAPGLAPGGAVPEDLDSAGRTRESLESELRTLRGDAIEAEGDAEARTLEWARERQEAETRLQSYRDRARELRARLRTLEDPEAPCPTCGQPLKGGGREELLGSLTDEWEMVVQDGRWWKRRREQLEERPQELRELENSVLRIRARAEEVIGLLEGVHPLVDDGEGKGGLPGRGLLSSEGSSHPSAEQHSRAGFSLSPALEEALRPFLLQAGSGLRRWSEGRLSGISPGEGGAILVREGRSWRAPTPSEEPALSVILQLALWGMVRSLGRSFPGGMILSGLDGRGIDPLLPLLSELPLDAMSILVVIPFGSPVPGDPRIRSVIQEEPALTRSGFRQVKREGIRLTLPTSTAATDVR